MLKYHQSSFSPCLLQELLNIMKTEFQVETTFPKWTNKLKSKCKAWRYTNVKQYIHSCKDTALKPPSKPTSNTYLRATASSLDKVKRSLLLLGNMAAKMSVNKPEEGKVTES